MTATFTNRKPLFIWGFTLVWVVMLTLMTWVLFRDGIPPRSSRAVVSVTFVFFWILGAGLIKASLSMPITRITAGRLGMTLRERYPHRRAERSFLPRDLTPAAVAETRDSDGDPYFNARVVTADGREIHLVETPDRAECQAACDRFNALVFR